MRELAGLFFLVGALLLLASCGVLAWQSIQWLRFGEWPTLPMTYVLALATDAGADSWLSHPREWVGVHKALTWLSLSGALFLAALLSMFCGAVAED